jgi:hypothetical protein
MASPPLRMIALMIMAGAVAFPTAADTLHAEVLRCAEVSQAEVRLDCFDGLAAGLRGVAVPAPSSAATPDRPTLQPPSDFGRDSLPTTRATDGEPTIEAIDAVVTAVRRRPRGEYVFELSNGQTWTELSPGRGRYEAGISVRIERTTLGGYMLSTPTARATRVRRLM